jgi:two-component system, OmpR family, catabolic regulation response regulator CreB
LKINIFSTIVLDVGLPDGNSFEFCKELRKTNDISVLFLTARSDEVDKIVGLKIGLTTT